MSEHCTPELEARLYRAAACVSLILAGVFAHRYGAEAAQYVSLVCYSVCLSLSAFLFAPTSHKAEVQTGSHRDLDRQPLDDPKGTINEDHGQAKTTPFTTQEELAPRRTPIQQNLDFDGTEALKTMDQVTGLWLVSEASDPAARTIRSACLDRVEGGETEIARAERWFDIADSLRSRTCRALPKAELRRSYVADHHGVSKEQVRQIDQGRYIPLNKLLDAVNPKTL